MKPELFISPVLPSSCPLTAYGSDMARLERETPFGASDDTWLVFAQSLSRFAALSADELSVFAPQAADAVAVSALSSGLGSQANTLRAARAMRRLFDPACDPQHAAESMPEMVVATQAVAEEQELVGAGALAYATLAALLSTLGEALPQRLRGNVLAQQGRASRQLGAMDLARGLYEDAVQIGYECDSLDLVAKGLLGLGVLSTTLGNQPAAVQHFERALLNAERVSEPELIRAAHHGLLTSCIASGNLDAALVHGWNALRLSIAPELRAEALINMAEICRLASEHEAAIRAYSVASEWTTRGHIRMHALSGALQSAIALDRITESHRLLREIDLVAPTVTDAYSRAQLGVDIAASLEKLGLRDAAIERLNISISIAVEHRFNKIVFRAEELASTWRFRAQPVPDGTETVARPHRSAKFKMVLRSLHGLASATT
jgi:tetratricopeptide (TPR) repeat protein